jgi:hypothetical protein
MPIPVMTIDIAMTVRSEWKMDLGRMLAALRDTIPNNREYGAAVRKRFGLSNALELPRWRAWLGDTATGQRSSAMRAGAHGGNWRDLKAGSSVWLKWNPSNQVSSKAGTQIQLARF